MTIAINTSQMNIVEIMTDDDVAGTSLAKPDDCAAAYRDMVVDAGPSFYLEHLNACTRNGIQPHFMLATLSPAGDRRAPHPPAACTPAPWSSTTWPSAAGSPGATPPT